MHGTLCGSADYFDAGALVVSEIRGERMYVGISASQTRKRLKGVGLGVRKVESAGKNRAVIIHTATGDHKRELQAIFADCLEPEDSDSE